MKPGDLVIMDDLYAMKPGDLVLVNDRYGRSTLKLGIIISRQENAGTYSKCKILLSDGNFAWRMLFELRAT